jgi:hypothetical protein
MMRAATYARFSSDNQSVSSIADQIEAVTGALLQPRHGPLSPAQQWKTAWWPCTALQNTQPSAASRRRHSSHAG